jgi:hypothetical protein
MGVLNIAILATLLPAILAFPQHGGYSGHIGHGPVKGSKLPSGFPTGFPHPSGIPGGPGAPFPAPGNGTNGGATGSGNGSPISTVVSPPQSNSPESTGAPGPVTIQSTLLIIPQPVSAPNGGESPASTGVRGGESPATGVPGGPGGSSPSGAPGSGSSPSQAPGSGPGSGSSPSGIPGSGPGNGESGATCGPATVTITHANTITVTVSASGAPESGAPGGGSPESQAPIQSQPASPSIVAPFPISNSSTSAGPTGTGTGVASGSALPVYSAPIVPPISPVVPVVSSTIPVVAPTVSSTIPVVAPIVSSTAPVAAPVVSSAAPVPINTVQEMTDGQPYVPATTSAPAAAAEAATQAPDAQSVPVQPLYAVKDHQQGPAPVVSSTIPVAALAQQPTSAAPASVVAPVSDASSVAPQPSSTAKASSGGKARGLLYGSLPAAQAFDLTNIGWCADWDSSVTPRAGYNTGTISCDFVPQLLSDADLHTRLWSGNSAGASYAMGFNEPDNCGGGGACMSVDQTVLSWGTHMSNTPALLVSPATTNDLVAKNTGLDFMTQFLSKCSGCKFQALAFHWYGNAWDINDTPGGLEPTIQAYQKLQTKYSIPELWISEMAPHQAPTEDQMNSMLSYLDGPCGVTRYGFNGLETGTGQQLTGMLASAYAA